MTIIVNQLTFKIEDIWATPQDFIDDLKLSTPPFFENEYIGSDSPEDETRKIILWSYERVKEYFANSYAYGTEETFKFNFINTFQENYPTYFPWFNGDFTSKEKITDMGKYSFSGEQPTAQTEEVFGTPKTKGKNWNFNQDNRQEAKTRIKETKSLSIEDFIGLFSNRFQTEIN